MNVIKYFIASVVVISVFLSTSCNDPSVIGTTIVDDEFINVTFTDTSTVKMHTIRIDSVRTYTPGVPLFGYILGTINDPVFGHSESELYTQINIGLNNLIPTNSLVNNTIDSAVLVLNYEEETFYGEYGVVHTLTVHELLEDLDGLDTFYSDQQFVYDETPLGELQFIPTLDSIFLTPHGQPDTSFKVGPQIRIPINNTFYIKQMLDTMLWNVDTSFNEEFKGLVLKSESAGESLFGINLSSAAANSELNRLMIYVRDDDSTTYDIQIDLRGARTTRFVHDYSGSIVEPFIDQEDMGDSLTFIQGMSGVDIEIDIPYIRSYEDYLINKVELEFFTAEIMEDDTSSYPPVPNLVISRKNESGNDLFIEDVSFGIANLNLELLFGGYLEEDFFNGLSVRKYTMNITEEVLSILSDASIGTKMKISPFVKSERPNRSVIFGPKHSTFPARLKLTFTEP